jgi:hypothetical protein
LIGAASRLLRLLLVARCASPCNWSSNSRCCSTYLTVPCAARVLQPGLKAALVHVFDASAAPAGCTKSKQQSRCDGTGVIRWLWASCCTLLHPLARVKQGVVWLAWASANPTNVFVLVIVRVYVSQVL